MRISLGLLIFISFFSLSVSASINNQLVLKPIGTITLPINDKFLYQIYLENDLTNHVQTYGSLLIRNSIAYFPKPNISLWLGYDWLTRHRPFSTTNNIWQQVVHNKKFDSIDLTMTNRLRMEEIMLPGGGLLPRMRYLLRFQKPIKEGSKHNFVISNDMFMNLAEVGTADEGLSLNRTFLGMSSNFTDYFAMQYGYELEYVNQSDENLNHGIIMIASYKLPPIQKGCGKHIDHGTCVFSNR